MSIFEAKARNQVILRDPATPGGRHPQPLHFTENKQTHFGELDTASARVLESSKLTTQELDRLVMDTKMFKQGFPNGIWKQADRMTREEQEMMSKGEAAGYRKYSEKVLREMVKDLGKPFPANADKDALIKILVLSEKTENAAEDEGAEKVKRGAAATR